MPLLRSEEYTNEKGRRVVKEYYGKIENGKEIITATCEEEFLTDAEVAEREAKKAEEETAKKAEEEAKIAEATAKQEQMDRIEAMLSQLLGK